MNIIEEKIYEILEDKNSTDTSKLLSKAKSTLNNSGQLVDAMQMAGKNINSSVKDSIGGIKGRFLGKIAGSTTKMAGGLAAGIVAGALKTVAFFIPDNADPKKPENDSKISVALTTLELPEDRDELIDLLQWIHTQVNLKDSIFGEQTVKTFKYLHPRVYEKAQIVANEEKEVLRILKAYAPAKKFGLF